MVRIGRFTC